MHGGAGRHGARRGAAGRAPGGGGAAAAAIDPAVDALIDRDWPLRDYSRLVAIGAMRWHLQRLPAPFPGAPLLLLVHGSGASTHSWRALMRALQPHFTVAAMDLPGHAFSSRLPGAPTLPAVAGALGELLAAERIAPALAVGHSAGAAILAHMALQRQLQTAAIVSLNGAFVPFSGLPGLLFAPLARLLSVGDLAARAFARRARDPAAVRRLIASTGSTLDAEGQALYARLLQRPEHVAGTLSMMAHWDLAPLLAALPRLPLPLWLVTGSRDRTVPPGQAELVRARLTNARRLSLEGLGHLAHEEASGRVGLLLLECARELRIGGAP